MRPTAPRWWRAVALLAAVAVVVASFAAPAAADPEDGNPTLQQKLEEAARGYNDAKARLDASKKRQAEIPGQIKTIEDRVTALTRQVGALAAREYQGQRVSRYVALLESRSPDAFLQTAETIAYLGQHGASQVKQLTEARTALATEQQKVATEIGIQQQQLVEMDKRKKDAEKALATVGGGPSAGVAGGATTAKPAPRNPDGTWPPENCSIRPDPTTNANCLTPRMLHAYQEARAAGFTHYTACFRQTSFGEHGKGRACDFAAAPNGFGGVATGADKDYGNRLAAWCLANADRIAVLYVIWFRQIWMASTGWRAYNGDGSPSGNHENHVHLSVQ